MWLFISVKTHYLHDHFVLNKFIIVENSLENIFNEILKPLHSHLFKNIFNLKNFKNHE